MITQDPNLCKRIIAPALRFAGTAIHAEGNIEIDIPDITLVGVTHYDKHMGMQLKCIGGDVYGWRFKSHYPEEGFIDQRGQFWNRTEAWKLAIQTGQLEKTMKVALSFTTDHLYGKDPVNRVLCSAIAYGDGELCIVGARHYDLIMNSQLQNLANEESVRKLRMKTPVQGFIDLKGNFLTREEGLVLATDAGQVGNPGQKRYAVAGRLFSEDLY